MMDSMVGMVAQSEWVLKHGKSGTNKLTSKTPGANNLFVSNHPGMVLSEDDCEYLSGV